ncbi:LPP20 family lipoprotein [Shewanella sp. 10N.7]|uniref:LPP20 family lipoprotein n=1 Tax=Shewanella sp. 10N.7 TaxID=2885093 RepID=UPI001E3CB919|nr:LPP20 family lipoprotein [Shewanella sp. 10N.7]MCC4832679.1 LPP20 family lipoprotein [Shewanella sp. 10N.7]
MKKLLMAMMSVAALSLVGCSSNDKYVQWETEAPEQFPKLTAVGYAPLATQPAKEQSHKVLMAMQASKIAAYRELAEQVYGQQVDAHSQMSEWLLNSETVSTQVSGMIKGAKVIKSYPAGDMYVTELELDFAQVWNLYQQDNRPRKIKEVTYF